MYAQKACAVFFSTGNDDVCRSSIWSNGKRTSAPYLYELSNFNRHDAIDVAVKVRNIDGQTVQKFLAMTSIEQGIMYYKAIIFNDADIAQRVKTEHRPSICKGLGRQVKHYDELVWRNACFDLVTQLALAKFSQKDVLEKTGDMNIAEASPTDKIWGVGLSHKNPEIQFAEKWSGNLLGRILMCVRQLLRPRPYDLNPDSTLALYKNAAQPVLLKMMDKLQEFIFPGPSSPYYDKWKQFPPEKVDAPWRIVFGGRFENIPIPDVIIELRDEIAKVLPHMQHLPRADNCTIQIYGYGGRVSNLRFHKDPPEYFSEVTSITLGGPRKMEFQGGSDVYASVFCENGDIYTFTDEAYTERTHGCSCSQYAVSFTFRRRKV